MRAPRALRRRRHLRRQRAEVLGPIHKTHRQSPWPDLGQKSADTAHRDGVAERGVETGEMFGDARIKEWLEAWPAGPAHEAVDDLCRRVTAYGDGRPLEDDVTIVYVHRPG